MQCRQQRSFLRLTRSARGSQRQSYQAVELVKAKLSPPISVSVRWKLLCGQLYNGAGQPGDRKNEDIDGHQHSGAATMWSISFDAMLVRGGLSAILSRHGRNGNRLPRSVPMSPSHTLNQSQESKPAGRLEQLMNGLLFVSRPCPSISRCSTRVRFMLFFGGDEDLKVFVVVAASGCPQDHYSREALPATQGPCRAAAPRPGTSACRRERLRRCHVLHMGFQFRCLPLRSLSVMILPQRRELFSFLTRPAQRWAGR